MNKLSPAAQAVLTALTQQEYGLDPADIPNEAGRMACVAAAALRAAADCLWVDKPDGANGVYETHRAQLLAIADELETQ
jgi:hypothetical protein